MVGIERGFYFNSLLFPNVLKSALFTVSDTKYTRNLGLAVLEFFKMILDLLSEGEKLYVARYFKKLEMDLDETWWTGGICDEEELIRFW